MVETADKVFPSIEALAAPHIHEACLEHIPSTKVRVRRTAPSQELLMEGYLGESKVARLQDRARAEHILVLRESLNAVNTIDMFLPHDAKDERGLMRSTLFHPSKQKEGRECRKLLPEYAAPQSARAPIPLGFPYSSGSAQRLSAFAFPLAPANARHSCSFRWFSCRTVCVFFLVYLPEARLSHLHGG